MLLTIYGINDPKLAVQDQIKFNYFDLVLKGRSRIVPVDECSAPTPLLFGRKIFGSSDDMVWAKRTEEFQLDLYIGHEEGMPIKESRAVQNDLQSKYNFPVKPRLEMLASAAGDRANVILPCANSRNAETLYQAVRSSSRLKLRKMA